MPVHLWWQGVRNRDRFSISLGCGIDTIPLVQIWRGNFDAFVFVTDGLGCAQRQREEVAYVLHSAANISNVFFSVNLKTSTSCSRLCSSHYLFPFNLYQWVFKIRTGAFCNRCLGLQLLHLVLKSRVLFVFAFARMFLRTLWWAVCVYHMLC